MIFISNVNDYGRDNIVTFFFGLFAAFFHTDPRVITRQEREYGWTSLHRSGTGRFDRA
jgi:hypothetical protein